MIVVCIKCGNFFSVCGGPGYIPPPSGGKLCWSCYEEVTPPSSEC